MSRDSTWPKSALLALPYSRLELPGWGKLLTAAGVFRSDGWRDAPFRTIRCKSNGYLIPLDLSNWSERLSYFLGRHHEIATSLFLRAVVRPGDTFIDIGGNVGFVTLHAASLVGPSGRVHTFEPNPLLSKRLQKLIDLNHLKHVTVHAMGLSDTPGEMTLRIINNHPGQGTLSDVAEDGAVTQQYSVPVRVADEILPADLPGPATIKIDVEGFELHVLRGMRQLLQRLQPTVFTEVSAEYLRRAGSSVVELFAFMSELGYCGYQVTTHRRPFRRVLELVKVVDRFAVTDENIAWLNPASPSFPLAAHYIG